MKVPDNYRYHCYNRGQPAARVYVQDGWYRDGTRRMVDIPAAMTKDCRYGAHGYAASDLGCSGCKWMPK